jgi:hypothetical protein
MGQWITVIVLILFFAFMALPIFTSSVTSLLAGNDLTIAQFVMSVLGMLPFLMLSVFFLVQYKDSKLPTVFLSEYECEQCSHRWNDVETKRIVEEILRIENTEKILARANSIVQKSKHEISS